MPQPTASDVHVNRPLTNILVNWTLGRVDQWAFMSMFPRVPVAKQSDQYFQWSREDAHRDEAKERAPGAAAPVTVRRLSTDNYNCKVYGIAEAIDDQTRSNADAPLSPERSATQNVADKMMLRQEKFFRDQYFTTGLWVGSTTGTDIAVTQYAAPSTGTPILDIRAQVFHLAKLNVPKKEMKLLIGPEVLEVFLDHDDFLDRLTDNDDRILDEQRIATILGIGQVVAPGVGENPTAEAEPGNFGSANANNYVFGDNMLLTWAPPNPSIRDPSAGYTFFWRGLVGGAATGMRILRWRDDKHHSDMIEGEAALDCKVVSPELGVFFTDVLP